jgi:hypothetical protein
MVEHAFEGSIVLSVVGSCPWHFRNQGSFVGSTKFIRAMELI